MVSYDKVIIGLKQGRKFARHGWNGVGMYIFLVSDSTVVVNKFPLLGYYKEGTKVQIQAHILMKTSYGTLVPWLTSQTDLLAEDWVEVT